MKAFRESGDILKHLDQLRARVRDIIGEEPDRDRMLLRICQLLHDQVSAYDWVGFYLADPEKERELVLGPFVGKPTEHVRIPFGSGICGQSAETLETFLVEDVSKESNYLACSATVQSEIVIPIIKDGKFVAELDIDSDRIAGFGSEDRRVLEEICEDLTTYF